MTRYLDAWGFDAMAVDINTSTVDGLGAGQKFIDEGARFLRLQSRMERLPFPSDRVRLIVANASLHYASDIRSTLLEFLRVLAPGGIIAILDTPFYERAEDGERMVNERVAEFGRKYQIPEESARRSGYLTFAGFNTTVSGLNADMRVHNVWPGTQRTWEHIRASISGRRIAHFPVVVIRK
jgi:SAM-dependent methyltransferase